MNGNGNGPLRRDQGKKKDELLKHNGPTSEEPMRHRGDSSVKLGDRKKLRQGGKQD